LALVVCVITIFPIYWMIVTTLRPTSLNLRYPPAILPTQIDLTAFTQLFNEQAIGRWILNSTLLALMATVICIGLAIFGAYALSILRWRGRGPFAVFLLMTQMLPEALIIVPIFAIYRSMTERGIPLRESLPGLALIDCRVHLADRYLDPEEHVRLCPKRSARGGAGRWRGAVPCAVPDRVAADPSRSGGGRCGRLLLCLERVPVRADDDHPRRDQTGLGWAGLDDHDARHADRTAAGGGAGLRYLPVVFYAVMQRYIVGGDHAGAVKG
jgi:multiple sugar transport system permease protein